MVKISVDFADFHIECETPSFVAGESRADGMGPQRHDNNGVNCLKTRE